MGSPSQRFRTNQKGVENLTMATDFTIKQDDQLPEILAVLKDDTDAEVNLTGILGVRFIMTNKTTNEVKVDAAASVLDAPNGLVKYSWEEVDTDEAGNYKGEFEVEFSDGRLETFPNDKYLNIKVVVDLGGVR